MSEQRTQLLSVVEVVVVKQKDMERILCHVTSCWVINITVAVNLIIL